MKMWRTLVLAAGLGAAGQVVAHAAPATLVTSALQSAAGPSLVQKTHGCHRSAQDSMDGWHRHVGAYCDWVRASRSRSSPYARCRTRCQYIGPIKTCKRVCN